MPAPTMIYVMPDHPTPAHRAQLVRSNKKLEQILGVTPSVVPIEAPSGHAHRRTRSHTPVSEVKDRKARQRGKLSKLFIINEGEAAPESAKLLLSRSSSTTTSPSSSATTSPSSDDSQVAPETLPHHRNLTPKRVRSRHRPPKLTLSPSSHRRATTVDETTVIDLSPRSILERTDVLSPLSPSKTLNIIGRARASSVEELDDMLKDIVYQRQTPNNKRTKMSRLARHFGTQPPLELVFPPSPTSRSRCDPKRYTYGLPPPMTRGAIPESDEEDIMAERPSLEMDGKVLQVFWNAVEDEQGRTQVMSALRELRA